MERERGYNGGKRLIIQVVRHKRGKRMSQPELNQTLAELGTELSMEPFREELQPLIEEVLAETGKNKYRATTKLVQAGVSACTC